MESLFAGLAYTGNPRQSLKAQAEESARAKTVEAFVNEIDTAPATLVGKNPWEMTRETWEQILSPVNRAYKSSITVGMEVAQAFLDRYGYTHNGYAFHPGSTSNSRHEVQVAYALFRGDEVPEEVIREYSKSYWEESMDLRGFRFLPMNITTDQERSEAIAYWTHKKNMTLKNIEDQFFQYDSEATLKLEAKWCDRLINEIRR